jgi:hypothetical protein
MPSTKSGSSGSFDIKGDKEVTRVRWERLGERPERSEGDRLIREARVFKEVRRIRVVKGHRK